MYERVMLLFLLKACFYVDLKIQKRENFGSLYETTKFLCTVVSQSAYTQQIIENLKYSVMTAGMKFTG